MLVLSTYPYNSYLVHQHCNSLQQTKIAIHNRLNSRFPFLGDMDSFFGLCYCTNMKFELTNRLHFRHDIILPLPISPSIIPESHHFPSTIFNCSLTPNILFSINGEINLFWIHPHTSTP